MTPSWVQSGTKYLTFMPLTTSTPLDLLAETKPHLNDNDFPNRPSLVQNLHQIASLAESFTEQRPRSTGNWGQFADNLDQEGLRACFPVNYSFWLLIQIGFMLTYMITTYPSGVDLWNISGLIRLFPADSLILVAARKRSPPSARHSSLG